MTVQRRELIDNKGLILKLAVICKDYSFIREIDEFFLYAGADKEWRSDIRPITGSERMHHVEEWVAGLKANAAVSEASEILRKVVGFILNGKSIPETDAEFLRSEISGHDLWKVVSPSSESLLPADIDQLLEYVVRGLPRAMYPLKNRRRGKQTIGFTDKYDVQDLFHALLKPWIDDIRPEEYTPSYAGASTRMDFLLRKYSIVCELKYVRSLKHSKNVGNEITIDIAHYRRHPNCEKLYAVIYDPNEHIANPDGLVADLELDSGNPRVRVLIIPTRTL